MKMSAFIFAFALVFCLCGRETCAAQQQPTRLPDAPKPRTGTIVGTVTDANNDTIIGANVVLVGPTPKAPRTVVSNDTGFFQFNDVEPGTRYRVNIRAQGFADWTSPPLVLRPGQYAILTGSKLRVAQARTSITVTPKSNEEIAREQVKIEEQQRIFGIIPNFFVVYNKNAVPLTPKLKFRLATRVLIDPVTIIGVALVAGFNQAGDIPNYGQGAQGYAKRFGAADATGATDIMIGGAILPSLLHQDPRYFYQGTGTTKSRAWHAISMVFVCKGDNGKPQPNYSTFGGDVASAAIATAYYPSSDRGAGRVFGTVLINTGERVIANLAQEFILRKLTPKAKHQN
jgi:hypothetical protein